MIRDPRNPETNYMVSSGSTHEFHRNLRKTLVLLKIEVKVAPIYFVVEGLSEWPKSLNEMIESTRYFYEEHTCPTNFIRIPLISSGGDHDPHGVFEFVDAVWMMDEYDADNCEEYLAEVFPQLEGGPLIDATANHPPEQQEAGNHMARDRRLLPDNIEESIAEDVLDGRMSLAKALRHRNKILNEYDANGMLIVKPGDKFGINYRGYNIARQFDNFDAAEAWGLWNYKGSLKGWRVITIHAEKSEPSTLIVSCLSG